mgnify:CR=1 FL=1
MKAAIRSVQLEPNRIAGNRHPCSRSREKTAGVPSLRNVIYSCEVTLGKKRRGDDDWNNWVWVGHVNSNVKVLDLARGLREEKDELQCIQWKKWAINAYMSSNILLASRISCHYEVECMLKEKGMVQAKCGTTRRAHESYICNEQESWLSSFKSLGAVLGKLYDPNQNVFLLNLIRSLVFLIGHFPIIVTCTCYLECQTIKKLLFNYFYS